MRAHSLAVRQFISFACGWMELRMCAYSQCGWFAGSPYYIVAGQPMFMSSDRNAMWVVLSYTAVERVV